MNLEDPKELQQVLGQWEVETVDLRPRVSEAIKESPKRELADLAAELQAMRQEVTELRRAVAVLQAELARTRGYARTRNDRITPFAPTESLIRLS